MSGNRDEAVTDAFDVCIVGAGPTGLLAANVLGAAGLKVLVVERNRATSTEAKAISLDDESVRTMVRAQLEPWVKDIVTPGTGTRYYGARGQLLFHATGPEPAHHGHAIKSPFAQPELEARLVDALSRFACVQVAFDTAVRSLTQHDDFVELSVEVGDSVETIRATFVLGCDGGRSTVREQLGIRMQGTSFEERWIVIDTVDDAHDQRYGMHVGNPRRPEVVIPGVDGRCRYEFLLEPDQAPEGRADLALVQSLLHRHRPVSEGQVERTAVYTFHALLAERWRERRCLLLGDAAHMMPPFAGQGLNSGVRDVNNLTWKLIAVLRGEADQLLLDTYESERMPHAKATIELSVRMGRVVMTTKATKAVARDLAARAAMAIPWSRRYLQEMRFRPRQRYARGFLSVDDHETLTGTAIGQPSVLRPGGSVVALDKVLGPEFSLLAVECAPWPPPPGVGALADAFGARRIRVGLDRFPVDDEWLAITDHDGELRRQLETQAGRLLLVRPDRYVAASFRPHEAERVLTDLGRYFPSSRPASRRPGRTIDRPTEVPA